MLFSITGLLRTSDGVGSSVAGRPMKDLWDWSEKSILQRDRKLLGGIGCWGNATMQEEEGFIYIYQVIAYRDLCSQMRGYICTTKAYLNSKH